MTAIHERFDVTLDMTDENFTKDLMKALDVKPGDTVNIMQPQFKRTDGRVIQYIPKLEREYRALPLMHPENLKKIGCQIWNSENGKTHWLYPAEWYEHIPAGLEVFGICGDTKIFEPGVTDDDRRFGALAYGFVQTVN